jgi:hypothetical protein
LNIKYAFAERKFKLLGKNYFYADLRKIKQEEHVLECITSVLDTIDNMPLPTNFKLKAFTLAFGSYIRWPLQIYTLRRNFVLKEALGIDSDKLEHIGRLFAAKYLNEEGAPDGEINRQGLWANNSKDCSYLESEPAWIAQRILAGFDKERSTVFWARATVEPSERLQKKVYPWLEKSIEEYNASGEQQCKAGLGLLTLFKCLRVVFLQDTAIMIQKVCFHYTNQQDEYKSHALFKHSLFQDPELIAFHKLVQHTNLRDEVPKNILLSRALPSLESTVRSLSSQIRDGHRTIMDSQSAMTRDLDAMRNNQTESNDRMDRGINNIQVGLYNHNTEVYLVLTLHSYHSNTIKQQ